ncbi:hypothetical protein [Stenotrophomonas sp. PS02289]|uniref:hypothetical protein n=1 Tax=Stenotrophomonas sp. PS02289 TaxID=2991422 RepID=UPI00249BD064|nr:hypothetical protein [Stenotrophomonas sp. PS02289]
MDRKKLLKFKEMEAIAKKATHDALMPYPASAVQSTDLGLATQVLDDEGIFELYMTGKRPSDSKVITRTRVDRRTGHATVEVFLDKPS